MSSYNGKYRLPVQRCIEGESVNELSDIELLAVILGTGTKEKDVLQLSADLLKKTGGLTSISRSGLREIAMEKGIGLKKAVKLKAAFELGKRAITCAPYMNRISTPLAVWELLLPETAGLQKEEFRVLVINNKNMLIKKSIVSIGTITEAIVHPREVFRDAIREGGSGIIVAHNHPSGNTTPSKQDIETTKRLYEAGKIVGIPLVDHIILADSSYYSMKENGYIP
ncbi:MAG TPA: DNA repair protein RadC [Spirochaetota bacterium]|nr:DNA repair protein RadC [Spirochaetota bacterium]HPJ35960.1 DNA repair protein RadC [Spirochaetota bacterium]